MNRIAVGLLALFSFSAFSGEVRLISSAPDSISVEINTLDISPVNVIREGVSFVEFKADGYIKEAEPGGPTLPVLRFQVLVPKGKTLSESIVLKSVRDVKVSHMVIFQDTEPIHSEVRRTYPISELAYQQNYGDQTIEIVETGFAGSDLIATVLVRPVFYDPRVNRLRIISKLHVRFDFETATTKQVSSLHDGMGSLARYVVVNPPEADVVEANAKIDLVIAHEDHKATLARYLSFKKMLGRQVHEYYVKSKSADEIRSIIKSEFQTATPPNSAWLVGSIDQIPSYRGSSDNTWSDFKYQDLSDDGIPDISVGRVPAMNSTELGNFIEKAIQRELDQPKVGKILLTAGSDTSLGCPANVSQVGEKFRPAGSDIELIKKYKTEVGTQDVINAYNADPNIIVYDGHGNRTSMAEIPLHISTLNQVTNRAYPIVLDIACLNANWTSSGASSRNFAESFLLQAKSGLAGIMASGGSGYGHDFFQTIAETMAIARKSLSSDSKLNEIGRVILTAKIKHGTQDRTYWNYYGDPASSVWESTQ